jgi:hypothetical protein
MSPKQPTEYEDDMEEEYDFATFSGGIRGKYAEEFSGTATTVLLDADVAKVFPDSKSVNEALRTLARILASQRKAAQP